MPLLDARVELDAKIAQRSDSSSGVAFVSARARYVPMNT